MACRNLRVRLCICESFLVLLHADNAAGQSTACIPSLFAVVIVSFAQIVTLLVYNPEHNRQHRQRAEKHWINIITNY